MQHSIDNLGGISMQQLGQLMGVQKIDFRIGPKGRPFANQFSPTLGRVVSVQVTEGFDHSKTAYAYNSQNVEGVVVLSNNAPATAAFSMALA
jgi:hypothetical protein